MMLHMIRFTALCTEAASCVCFFFPEYIKINRYENEDKAMGQQEIPMTTLQSYECRKKRKASSVQCNYIIAAS